MTIKQEEMKVSWRSLLRSLSAAHYRVTQDEIEKLNADLLDATKGKEAALERVAALEVTLRPPARNCGVAH